MYLLQDLEINCPYCGESITITVDTSQPRADYIEDCAVCCRPIYLQATSQPGDPPDVRVRREDDADQGS